jgi:flagellin
MSSINTNVAAMTALQSLSQTNKNMLETQNRISTGLRVGEASDNAAYWSIATTMRSDNSALSTVKDALGLGAATVDVQYSGIKAAIDVVDEIKSKLVAARQPGVDRDKIQADITELQGQLQSIGESAVFNGENWLSTDSGVTGYNGTKTIVSSFSRAADGTVSIGTISVDAAAVKLYDADTTGVGIIDGFRGTTGTIGTTGYNVATLDISALTDSAADLTTLEQYIVGVDKALNELTDTATNLGSTKKRVDLQKDFISGLMDAIDRGVGQLVDADMNEESTRLQALQVQQQLGIQALSIANSSSQNILSLFR